MELTNRVREALRFVAGLDMTPRSYNDVRDLTQLAHRYMQWHEISVRDAVRLVALAEGRSD